MAGNSKPKTANRARELMVNFGAMAEEEKQAAPEQGPSKAPPGASRRQWWSDRDLWVLPTMLGGDDEALAFVRQRNQLAPEPEEKGTLVSLLRKTREAVFYMEAGRPRFALIMYALDTKTMAFRITETLQVGVVGDEAVAWKEAKHFLALAKLEEVPVLADTPELQARLIELIQEILESGFETELDGKPAKFWFPDKHSSLRQPDGILSLTRHWLPAEHELVRRRLVGELERLRASGAAVAILDVAIAELEHVLASGDLEGALQRCATKNPILFGWEYERVSPQHRLGSDFVMDYALVRYSGAVDLLEIEQSRHALYTSKRDPSKELVHAEQQVYDWLDWIEKHGGYAREKLPGLLRPQGFVVIGRRASLDDRGRRALQQRNQVHRGVFEVLTWDDLLDRAKALRSALQQNR